MAEIALSGKHGLGKVALVDDSDLAQLNAHRWHLDSAGYPRASIRQQDGRTRYVRLHQLLFDERGGGYRDHINGDPLDNRRANLRPCTRTENNRNRRAHRNNKTGLKGVSPVQGGTAFAATIHVGRRQVWLGTFPHRYLAALAYNAAATALHGAFARLNPIPDFSTWLHEVVPNAAD